MGVKELRETNHCTLEKTGVTQKSKICGDKELPSEDYRLSPRMQALAFTALNGRSKSRSVGLHTSERGENKMRNQKLVSRSFSYTLKVCYQTAGNPGSLGNG